MHGAKLNAPIEIFSFGVTGLAYSLKLGSNKDVGLKYLTIKFEYLEEKIRCIPIFARIATIVPVQNIISLAEL